MKNPYPLIKVLQVDNSTYIYDAKSNFLTEINNNDVIMEDGELRVKQSILEKYSHIFHKGEFKKVVPDDCELENIVDYQLKSYFPRKFTLEVTENCNLRCKYCLFAREENGITRKHTFCNMDIYTAKKAIDFYFNFYTSQLLKIPEDKQEKIASISPPRLSWWGGEPFLAFDIIKESKQYFESLNWGKFGIKLGTLTYITVSNLTIMNDEIATFLANNNVLLSVSLDGGKQENDLNRVLANGKGTFDIVIANLDFLIEKYPEYAKEKIIIQSVFAENIDIEKSYDFVKKHFNLNTPAKKIQKHIVFSEKKVKILFANNVKISKRNELDNFKIKLEELAEKSEEKIIDILKYDNTLDLEFSRLFLLEQRLTFDNPQNSDLDTNLFSCPIGADNIFISANGDFHMCMKSDYSFPLGNVFSGFDKQALITLYKSHIIGFRKKCKNCWAICFCQICPAQILFEKQFYFPTNEDCNIIKGKALVEIQKYILLTRYENLYNQIKQFYTNSQSDDYRLDTGLININYLNHLLL